MDNVRSVIAAATLALLGASVAQGATITLAGTNVTIAGDIVSGDRETFINTVRNKEVETVTLDSKGGEIMNAMAIGEIVHKYELDTTVPEKATCASACALIWIAGQHRSIGTDGRVGFHAAYVERDGQKVPTGEGNAMVGAYLAHLGFDYGVVAFATQAGPDSITWVTPDEGKTLGFPYTVASTPDTTAAPPTGCAKAMAQIESVFGSTKGVSCKE